MKKTLITPILFFFIAGIVAVVHADLSGFMNSLNVQARADMNGFSVRLSTQFGVPLQQVHTIIRTVATPADAFMCLQLSKMTKKHHDKVLQTYKNNKGQGWGVIAKKLGIKPGSPEFHALKRGDFVLTGEPDRGFANGKGKVKAKEKDKEKEKGKGHNKKNRDE